MTEQSLLRDPDLFCSVLFGKMKGINPGIADMEPYEFRYALDNLYPKDGGRAAVELAEPEEIERLVNSREFYTGIQVKPRADDRVVLDSQIVRLTNMLFVGLATGKYAQRWVLRHFYFDVRGFFFLHRNTYLTDAVVAHLGGKPFKSFARKQKRFARWQAVGYKAFREANTEVDELFIASVKKLVAVKGTLIVMAIAGATAAGKTEIVARLRTALQRDGRSVSAIIKAVYLIDDAVRLKRKWIRDIDYRKKHEPTYFRNRFFKDQFLMAQFCYLPQLEACDMAVDTTGAALWTTPETAAILGAE